MLTRVSTDELHSEPEDTRDTTAFPDAEANGQPRFESFLTWGPKPDVSIIKVYCC